MKALVVYESMFGNTEEIAHAIADGLGESVEVQLAEVADAPVEPNPDVALIVVGGPTHAFSMSRT
jgi:flavodoxin